MEQLKGKTVEMWVDGLGKLTCVVANVIEDKDVGKCLVVTSKGGEFRIPVTKIGIHHVVSDKSVEVTSVGIWMCKNDPAGCKGVKRISSKTLTITDMPCDTADRATIECEFARVGCLYDLPIDLQAKFLEGMTTGRGPVRLKMPDTKPVEKVDSVV